LSASGEQLGAIGRALSKCKVLRCFELSVSHNFMDEYMQPLFLPHTDLNAFPTLKHQMRKAKTWYPPE